MTTLAALEKGHEFPPASFDLSEEWVDAYVAAVEDEAIGALDGGFVPPMAVTALAIRALLENASLPPGTLHIGQELAFTAPVRRGETLTVAARIASRGKRAGWALIAVELRVAGDDGTVMTGRVTLSFPAAEGTAV
ncbi:MAG: MaoC family dehydratase [Chloroflexi bacterium]|nr:MaoC family dehydratase [Chloroflexota bacterium]MCI0832483.1 MaoC family dehydratase [Chloroflexota bacterium]MCI0838747.1 MaoC family dehydratase [Chloroflexota bacterium]